MTLLIGRRGFLGGLIAAIAAPAIVRAESLMPIRAVAVRDIFVDGITYLPPHLGNSNLDRYLLERLKEEAEQQGFKIRAPRFLGYQTQFNSHRRCSVELVR